jgi:hypothetical protein
MGFVFIGTDFVAGKGRESVGGDLKVFVVN